MGVVVDSSVLIAVERGAFDLAAKLPDRSAEEIGLSAITASELLHGVHRASQPVVRARREAFVERILSSLAVVPFDDVVARVHSRLWATLASRGTNVAAHDLIIAATAVARGWAVATRDARSFSKIPGLHVELWK